MDLGHSFGVAWPRGAVSRRSGFSLAAHGSPIPAQSWPTAYWPDGSVKWTAHALPASLGEAVPDDITVTPGTPGPAPSDPIRVEQTPDGLRLTCAGVTWDFAKSGNAVIRSAAIGGRTVMGPVSLVGQMGAAFAGTVTRLTLEQSGPVRAIVKIEGVHRQGQEAALPFTLRFYAYAGARHLRIVHSFIYDGDPARDAIAALGVSVAVPMRDALHDRHIRIASDGPLFAEAVRPLTGLRRDPGAAFRHAQVEGRATPPIAQMAAVVRDKLQYIPTWSDFWLEQPNADGFRIEKRTQADMAWVASASGHRAPGLAYVGGHSGGAAIAQRWFWQTCPSALSVRDAASTPRT
jgi:hypothetical protein